MKSVPALAATPIPAAPAGEVGRTSVFRPPWVFALVGKAGWGARLNALFGESTGANWIFLATLVIGFIHGWMKFKNTGLVTTFAFDVPLTLALGLALLKQGSSAPWFPVGDAVSDRLKALALLSLAYGILPLGVPWLAGLASFRAWVVVPLVYLLGYHVTRSVRQVELVLLLILALSAGAAVYGIRQSPEEIRQMMLSSPEMQMRLGGAFFASESGEGVRRFSTFVSPAAFGGTMAASGIFAFAYLTQPGMKVWRRILFGVVLVLCAYGIKLSGARTAIAMLGTGLGLTAWARGKLVAYAIVPGVAIAIISSMGILLDPVMAERFASLLDPAQVWGRVYIVLWPSASIFVDYPLGGGLGRSGHGVPWVFRNVLPYWEVRGTDGDFGRIIADFGIAGLICFGALFYSASSLCIRWMKGFRGTGIHTLAICAGANFILAVLTVVTGSPFLGIPGGAVSWFLLGAMSKLATTHDRLLAQVPATEVWRDPRLIPFGSGEIAPVEPFGPAGTMNLPPPVVMTEGRPAKRFLYAKESGQAAMSGAADSRRTVRRGASQGRRLYGDGSAGPSEH